MPQPPTPGQERTLAPVAPEERIALLDVLRGFALFGILVMNMPAFNAPFEQWALDPRLFPGAADRAAAFAADFLVAGKANSMFSFLFGLGLTIQMRRAEARGGSIVPVALRRAAFLFAIGAAHGVLLWGGDVLHVYAVLGVLLLAARRLSNRWIFALIALCLAIPMVREAVAVYREEPMVQPLSVVAARAQEHLRIFQQGTYLEQVAVRIEGWVFVYYILPRHFWGFIGTYLSFSVTILLGFYAGRERILENVAERPWVRKATWWCLGVGLSVAVGFAVFAALYKPTGRITVVEVLIGALYSLNRPVLCLAYIGVIALLYQRPRFRRLLAPLATAGRLPLTNYLMQSVIATTIFNSYGLGLFGKVGPALGLVFTAGIFTVQVMYSTWWMARFQFGPLEWLWRGATYGKLPPLRKAAGGHAAAAVV